VEQRCVLLLAACQVLATFSLDFSSSEASAIAERLEELLMGQVPMPSSSLSPVRHHTLRLA